MPAPDNYMLYTGDNSVYTYTFGHKRKPDCPVCGNLPKDLSVSGDTTLGELVESFAERPDAQLKKVCVKRARRAVEDSASCSARSPLLRVHLRHCHIARANMLTAKPQNRREIALLLLTRKLTSAN